MTRYVIINETTEVSVRNFSNSGSLFDALCIGGLKNGSFSEIAVCETMEQARDELKNTKAVQPLCLVLLA